ncbi:hypothetical protein Tco_0691324 [Tanacetum coccineum]
MQGLRRVRSKIRPGEFSKETAVARDPDSEKSTSFTSLAGSPGDIYQPGLRREATAKIARRDQRIQAREEEIKRLDEEVKSLRVMEAEVHGLRNQAQNLESLMEAEVDMKKVAEAKNADLAQDLESLRSQITDLQLNNNQLSQQACTLQAQVTGEERIKAAFEEFKRDEHERVSAQCAEMDARLDARSIDFDEELYPHMLTTIVGRQWVIGHGLRLAVLKCTESMELRQAFANVVSAGITKGFCDGLKFRVEQGESKLDLATIEGYDPEAEGKFMVTMQDLKDLKYRLIDELEKLKDAPMDVLMVSLYFESDTEDDAPQWIRDLRPSSAQLKIPVYPKKKRKSRVVCRIHGVGSSHHARSDGVPVSAPTVVPQGLAILLVDAVTQMNISEEGSSPKLIRGPNDNEVHPCMCCILEVAFLQVSDVPCEWEIRSLGQLVDIVKSRVLWRAIIAGSRGYGRRRGASVAATTIILVVRTIHEGRPANYRHIRHDNILLMFQVIKLQDLYEVCKEICPRFLLEFYASTELIRNSDQTISLKFWALKRSFLLSLESLSCILLNSCEGDCIYSEDSSLESLRTSQELNNPYQTNIPTPNEIIQDNAFGIRNDLNFLPASSCHMIYNIMKSIPYNLTYLMIKRKVDIKNQPNSLMPYGMLR